MKSWLKLLVPACAGIWLIVPHSSGSPAAQTSEAPRELQFDLVKIDGPVHDPARHTYWFGPFAECSSILDINGDGKPDIAAGRNYYLAPNWTKYSDYRDGAQTNGPDVDDNYESTLDVNNDGRMDVLSSGWMLRQGVWWYENPGKTRAKWESHNMLEADGVEGAVVGNLAGHDGKDVLVNYFARKPGRGLIWFEHLNQAPWFKQHTLGPENIGVSHGSGIGDINGDGRDDVVTTSGWFESPARPAEQPWIWHPDYDFVPYGAPEGRSGGAGLPILITDVNGDGLNDIILGSDHGYGLAWLEQKMVKGKRSFVRHWIETEYPTFHTMALADLDGDGKPELITGKQLLAHNGGDVGALEPTFVFWYKFHDGKFERHVLSYSYLQPFFRPGNKDVPPNYVIGVGMRLSVGDLNGDGRPDIVVACRTGLYVFFNKGYGTRTGRPSPLPDRNSYPGNVEWENRRPTGKGK
ncbi:MAG: VCBS repeat-containing protein [Bryobacteraceae bacterium]